ncbi:pyridoxal-phosphate dependent enzyme [Roseomonas sp. NAR14]|uniref:Pyridoxal-phosphate dependent enzyme n=1 Tax=Roseomonas acroporae TaxID=2937791 RepID=A0A9X1YB48_9PROT|nr:pyridoxal-phosphate dependent enzyme [Roseomonas acroporae]MCK8785690.1 pyridoxal-phosphate dependent enzyme [Roseomonas acroporae]
MRADLELGCVRCGARYPLSFHQRRCPACLEAGAHASLLLRYAAPPGGTLPPRAAPSGDGLWRWDAFLPLRREAAVTLAEGGTPLLPAEALGLGPLLVKDETRNPTGSFKDRLASVAVSAARALGHRVIAAASSGNAGAAAAAYAARAGLPCVVFTMADAAGPMLAQIVAYGAHLVRLAHAPDRFRLLSAGVTRHGWFATSPAEAPITGSSPFGVEGCKTLAYEIAEAMEWRVPDWVLVPVCYGDALTGLARGFAELRAIGWTDRVPRLVAAETSGSLVAALAEGAAMPPARPRNAPGIAPSIGAAQGTVQALQALRETDGLAVAIDDEALGEWHLRAARRLGLYLEPASVAPLAALARLRAEGIIAPDATVVALATATGLKDTARTMRLAPEASGPVLDMADPDAALAAVARRLEAAA